MTTAQTARVVMLGDSCMSVAFEEKIDPAINARCVALASVLNEQALPGVRDIVPGFHSVAVYFDPLSVRRAELEASLASAAKAIDAAESADLSPIVIPVHYGGSDGPDLPGVSEAVGCSESDVIRLHTARTYRVYMLGFLPGFAYLASVDPRIAVPRLGTPRLAVPAGSVGIAGEQTGVYPSDGPGGWRLIGRTDLTMFDPTRESPSLMQPGQPVRFVAA